MNATNAHLRDTTPALTFDECTAGRLVRNVSYAAFKVQIILGHIAADRVRVCTWSANQRCWSRPLTAKIDALRPIRDDQVSPRQQAVVRAALANVTSRGNEVRYAGGARPVESVHVTVERSKQPADKPTITKLAPVHGKARVDKPLMISDEAKTQAQKLNAKLSGWMFGKGK